MDRGPGRRRRLFDDQIAGHRERLSTYEQYWRTVQSHHDGGPPPVTHPDFGNYATLRCGIDYERQRIAWLAWMSRQLAAHQAGAPDDPAGEG